jgi:hypothetical protein
MKTMIALAGLVAFAIPTDAKEPDQLVPFTMEVGSEGVFLVNKSGKGTVGRVVLYTIKSVNDDSLEIHAETSQGEKETDFIVKGIDTKGIVDGKPWRPTGVWKVTGTTKVGKRTLFVVEKSK